MSLRFGRLGLLVACALACPALAGAQPVAIEHQDVACIVAGQFPVLDACFRPGPGLARARVYFRPEGVPNWYYVDASAPAPPNVGDAADLVCRRATLPKPKKSLIEKHVEYYVDATGRKQESSQTETFRPLVVKSEGDCKKKAAGFVPNAIVTVFPSLPAAFTVGGGLSGAAVAALVGAGVAGGTGVVIAATSGGGSSGPTTTNPPVATVPPTTVPPTTATTTLPPVAFNPVFKVFSGGVLEPANKIAGKEPVKLQFFMCESTGPLPLKYNVLVNGSIVTAGCDSTITFKTGGFVPGFGGVAAQGIAPPSSASYDVLMRIQSDGPGNNPKDSRALTVDVTGAPPPTTTTTTTTLIPFSGPFSGNEVHLQAPDQRPATWVSQLDVPGGRGQIVLNGREALFPAAGRAPLSVRPRSGDNRVEAQLVQGQGRAGLWRFELTGDRTVAGSLRVIAGQVALVTGDVVVFRLKGQPGERVVFTFTGR